MNREMTDKEFKAALKRHGFEMYVGSLWINHVSAPHRYYGAAVDWRTLEIQKRATIKKILEDHARQESVSHRRHCFTATTVAPK